MAAEGTVLVEELEKLAKETEFAAGYVRVKTPHIAREKMYLTSGHLPYYADSMFPPMELHEGREGESCGDKGELPRKCERQSEDRNFSKEGNPFPKDGNLSAKVRSRYTRCEISHQKMGIALKVGSFP